MLGTNYKAGVVVEGTYMKKETTYTAATKHQDKTKHILDWKKENGKQGEK